MPVWNISQFTVRPNVTLISWAVFEAPLEGANDPWRRLFAGYSITDRQGQSSSAVKAFDPIEGCGITRSGRAYLLKGAPCTNLDAEYVWNNWKALNGIAEVRNVTAEVRAEILAAQAKAPQETST